jgi:hypothetical protein
VDRYPEQRLTRQTVILSEAKDQVVTEGDLGEYLILRFAQDDNVPSSVAAT